MKLLIWIICMAIIPQQQFPDSDSRSCNVLWLCKHTPSSNSTRRKQPALCLWLKRKLWPPHSVLHKSYTLTVRCEAVKWLWKGKNNHTDSSVLFSLCSKCWWKLFPLGSLWPIHGHFSTLVLTRRCQCWSFPLNYNMIDVRRRPRRTHGAPPGRARLGGRGEGGEALTGLFGIVNELVSAADCLAVVMTNSAALRAGIISWVKADYPPA